MKKYYFDSDRKFSVVEESDNVLDSSQVRIKMKNCGICGSDIHYYLFGENGGRKIIEPLMLGHEFVGEIIELGSKVLNFNIGDRVIINPALNCEKCIFCRSGKKNLCEHVSFFGSAANFPHTQGAFRENIEIHESQCYNIMDSISFEEAAFAEPLAVSLHACSFINNFDNKKILVSGCGPIGLLILKIILQSCDQKNIFVADVNNNVLNSAKNLGIKNIINVNSTKSFVDEYRNCFDLAFESSGNVNSINNILATINKGGEIIQVGNMPGGLLGVDYNKIMLKELKIIGSYRFYKEFKEAVNSINNKLFKFKDMLTHKFKLYDCEKALKVASNKDLSIKVQVFT
jgi:L-idonate 5-dehydrogenase